MNKFVKISHGVGNEMYKTSCHLCGGPVYSWMPKKNVKFKCKDCRSLERESEKQKNKQLRMLEADRRFDIAIDFLEKKGILEDYSRPLDIINKHLYKQNWFQSSNEIIMALELLRIGVIFKHQVKVNRFRTDFLIPSMKIVLEIDGSLHHHKGTKEKERYRDTVIIATLGPKWEVIRIKDEMIKKNPQNLLKAIKRVMKQRGKLREENNHKLPGWYADNHI